MKKQRSCGCCQYSAKNIQLLILSIQDNFLVCLLRLNIKRNKIPFYFCRCLFCCFFFLYLCLLLPFINSSLELASEKGELSCQQLAYMPVFSLSVRFDTADHTVLLEILMSQVTESCSLTVFLLSIHCLQDFYAFLLVYSMLVFTRSTVKLKVYCQFAQVFKKDFWENHYV